MFGCFLSHTLIFSNRCKLLSHCAISVGCSLPSTPPTSQPCMDIASEPAIFVLFFIHTYSGYLHFLFYKGSSRTQDFPLDQPSPSLMRYFDQSTGWIRKGHSNKSGGTRTGIKHNGFQRNGVFKSHAESYEPGILLWLIRIS